MQTKLTQLALLLFCMGSALACRKDEAPKSETDFYVALPSPPVRLVNTTGEWLVYEMHVKTPALESVEIRHGGELVLEYANFNSLNDLHIGSIWLEFPAEGWEQGELEHRFYYREAAGGELREREFVLPVERAYPDPKTIAFPVPGGVWLAEGAAGPNSYHTRSLFPYDEPRYDEGQEGYLFGNNPQRFAIDYALLEDGLPYVNDGTQLSDWHCYNMPVLAAQGGVVIFTKDGIPDNQTPWELDYETDIHNATGNVVYVEHADGTIGTYCHLVPHSIEVAEGDTVVTGQALGRLGNSGNSFAPHLHMHVLTNPEGKTIDSYPDGLFMESLPYRFESFTRLGQLEPGFLDVKPIEQFVPTGAEEFELVLPSESDVISF